MKKSLFIVASAALVLASCNNDVTLDENTALAGSNTQKEITFTTYAQTAKRAKANAPVADATFPTAYHFYIAAYDATKNADYFGKTEYANESSTIWAGVDGQEKYWPLVTDTLNFLAVTKAGESATTFGTTGENFASKVVVALADNRTAQHDLMYAAARDSVRRSGSVFTYPNVPMQFKHAQAWVNFTVKAADAATAAAGIVVTGITLKQAVYNGTATVTLTNYEKAKGGDLSASVAWDGTAYGSATKYDVAVPTNAGAFTNVAVNGYAAAIPAGDGLMIVPNPNETASVLDPSFTSIVISYTQNGRAASIEYTPEAAQKRMVPGKKYNYNIVFTLTEIKVNASVETWGDGGSETVDVPQHS